MIIVDDRESRSGVPDKLKGEWEYNHLKIGDYVIPKTGICIERKEGGDFISSANNGRLFEQINRMTDAYDHPILLIE